jgi:L-alanine-DL-glutamate epimerase-like enolase superfamily enzyme
VQAATAFDPYWIEDPFPADDLQSFAWLARKSGLRLATGEFQSSPLAIEYAGMIGAASVIQVEAPRCGGVTGWLQIARVADRHGMTMCPCWFHQLHAHLVPSIPNGQFVEYFHGTDVLNFERLIDRSSTLADGCVAIPDLPGLGFEFDDDCIRRHCVAQLELRHRH